jgi:hypothetical protein
MKNKNVHKINNNIYITSDEEIKEGDWVYCRTENRVLISNVSYSKLDDRFKIILTTDQDLIKDGVHAIDDEFLEWFVKNPSCEKVEVTDYFNPKNIVYGHNTEPYKIIIPQGEPKQEELKFKNRQIGAAGFVANQIMENMINKPKLDTVGKEFYETADMTITVKRQETLEEFINEELEDVFFTNISKRKEAERLIELGAKWQAEGMYSKEEVEQIARFGFNAGRRVELKAVDLDFTFEKWFEEFKKK